MCCVEMSDKTDCNLVQLQQHRYNDTAGIVKHFQSKLCYICQSQTSVVLTDVTADLNISIQKLGKSWQRNIYIWIVRRTGSYCNRKIQFQRIIFQFTRDAILRGLFCVFEKEGLCKALFVCYFLVGSTSVLHISHLKNLIYSFFPKSH